MKNFTPHDVHLVLPDRVEIIPTVGVCRAHSEERCAEILDFSEKPPARHHRGNWTATQPAGHLVVMDPPVFNGLEWLPDDPAINDEVIVSVVAAPVVAAERPDLTVYVPDTGPNSVVRNQSGQIEGVRRMILWHRPPTQIEVIVPYNPANPYDGWETIGSFRESEWSKAIDMAAFTGCSMYLVPGMQAADANSSDAQRGESRDAAKSYLTGGEKHWQHISRSGERDADQGRSRDEDIEDGCWARRAYDEGYDSVISSS